MSRSIYADELREIRRKSRQVYAKHGITPFLSDSARMNRKSSDVSDGIPGFQIFSLWGDILDDLQIKDDK
jgi:hypothetical protein